MQVVHLNNLDFSLSSTRHGICPRVKDFSFDVLDKLIKADKTARDENRLVIRAKMDKMFLSWNK
jgi:hypothetical protein